MAPPRRGRAHARRRLGGDYYCFRFSRDEFRTELEGCFDIDLSTGIRNIPTRSLAEGLRRVGLGGIGDPLLDFAGRWGHTADFILDRTPLPGAFGLFWLAKVRAPAAAPS